MGLYQQWLDQGENLSEDKVAIYWGAYFEAEKEAYKIILDEKNSVIEGTVSELADKFGLTNMQMTGFIDGINTSLASEVDLEPLESDTPVVLDIVWESLFENMLKNKAKWLYELDEWDGIISKDRRQDIKADFNRANMAVSKKVGRNEPCPCGSGKKYKNCCLK